MQIEWTKCLWKTPKHTAFTDLLEYKGQLLCCFREATNHVSADGCIRIVTLDTDGNRQHSTILRLPRLDLRDPKLSQLPDGRLLLIGYARVHDANGKWQFSRPLCWFSSDGLSWSAKRWFGDTNWWLWRITWQNGTAYGFAYNRASQAIRLYAGNPMKGFYCVKDEVLSYAKHGLGYPNESDICFAQNGQAYAIVRRDADTCSAQFGVATPPYMHWKWQDLGVYIGGPAMLIWQQNQLVIAGRDWHNGSPKTAIWVYDIDTQKLCLVKHLPSAGDTSYPGMHKQGNALYLSYYSSHEDNSSNIYLTKLIETEFLR